MKIFTRQYLFIWFLSFFLIFTSCKTNSKSKSKKKITTEKKSQIDPKIKLVVKTAKSHLGTKYKYGGTTSKGFDCSGLMCTSFKEANITLPRTSNEQSNFGKSISKMENLKVGDLVFFGNKPKSKKITHVGMITFVSKTSIKFIHASTKSGVVESDLFSNWYKPRYIKGSRPINP